MEKSKHLRCLEFDRGKSLEEIIKEGFDAGMTWGDIAEDLKVSRLTLRTWARAVGARVRTRRLVEFGSEGNQP